MGCKYFPQLIISLSILWPVCVIFCSAEIFTFKFAFKFIVIFPFQILNSVLFPEVFSTPTLLKISITFIVSFSKFKFLVHLEFVLV